MELLEGKGAKVAFHDPHVAEIPPTREHATLAGRRSLPFDQALEPSPDAALILTDHQDVDYAALLRSCPLVVDTRNVITRVLCDRADIAAKVVKA
jgi:UDP-N-acetyl-D-glucosamine dehydrogenase